MSYELILTEKPAAAKKIASALAEKGLKSEKKGGVTAYHFSRGGHEIVVACAVGHLYNLEGVMRDKSGKKVKAKYTYPVMEVMWKPSHEVSKQSAFTKKYLTVIKRLAKAASSFVIATDYDVEGELIGWNVLRFACKQKDAARMKFSTLTKHDLEASYESKNKHLNWHLARAGETRHILDWLYGINLSRALTLALKKAGAFRILSSGRVQGPALKIIVEREGEIAVFKPKPYWELNLHLRRTDAKTKKAEIIAHHKTGKFWKEDEVRKAHERIEGKPASVEKVSARDQTYLPPAPFDLTTFQLEVNRCFGINPKYALDIAQKLYLGGYISYPRTSSQKLPSSIGYKKIITDLLKNHHYEKLAGQLLSASVGLAPREGKKDDPAHPAIYPTGTVPTGLGPREQKLYDLIVKRFLAVFAEPSVREHMAVIVKCDGELFKATGVRTVTSGWQEFYAPYVGVKETTLPELEQGQSLDVLKSELLSKETKPPKRYSQASLVRELSKRNLGTKATRAGIVDQLFKRGYVLDDSMQATSLGIAVVETLSEHCPRILDEKLTRSFEAEMVRIESGAGNETEVLEKARGVLLKILEEFKEQESDIGKTLLKASKKSWVETREIGKCKECKGTLVIKRGKFGSFVACTGYPKCTVSFKLPQTGKVTHTGKTCEACGNPIVKIFKARRKPQEVCVNSDCPTKQISHKLEVKIEHEHKKCPKCDKELVLRKSIYGEFLGCSGYPKCRHTENIGGDQKKFKSKGKSKGKTKGKNKPKKRSKSKAKK